MFEKKIKRFIKLKESGWDYVWVTLKESRLTTGFWNKYGYKMDALLDDFYENYPVEFKAYCDTKGWCYDEDYHLTPSDFMF